MATIPKEQLATIKSKGSVTYALTEDDVLWAARMVCGEGGDDAADVLWCTTQRFVMFREQEAEFKDASYRSVIQAFSQPINPSWLRDGVFCKEGGKWHDSERYCSKKKLDNRDLLHAITWEEMEKTWSDKIDRVREWATGALANPVPRATNFAAEKEALGFLESAEANLKKRDEARAERAKKKAERTGTPYVEPEPLTRPKLFGNRGNVFIIDAVAVNWADDYVTIAAPDGSEVAAAPVVTAQVDETCIASESHLPIDLGSGTRLTPAAATQAYKHTEVDHEGGYFPLGIDAVWHGGLHLRGNGRKVLAPCDGRIVAARLSKDGNATYGSTNFILIEHVVKGGDVLDMLPEGKLEGFTVRTDRVNLRPDASTHGGKLGELSTGDELTIEELPFTHNEREWAKVKVAKAAKPELSGKVGWVAVDNRYILAKRAGQSFDLDRNTNYTFYTLLMHLGCVAFHRDTQALANIPWVRRTFGRPDDLSAAVGEGGSNAREDVRAVQHRLRMLDHKVTTRGECDTPTREAIKLIEPSGRIDPRSPAWQKLCQQTPVEANLIAGKLVKLDVPVQAGTPLYVSGEFGDSDYRTGLVHWEVFSAHNLMPHWSKAEDNDEDFQAESAAILGLIKHNEGWFESDEEITPEELIAFYKTNPSAEKLRKYVCKFVSEWGVNLDTAIASMDRWITWGLKDRLKPYMWWPEVKALGVPLPPALCFHYNPIAFQFQLLGPEAAAAGAPAPSPSPSPSPSPAPAPAPAPKPSPAPAPSAGDGGIEGLHTGSEGWPAELSPGRLSWPGATAEQRAFMERTYRAHVLNSSRGKRAFYGSLPSDQIYTFSGPAYCEQAGKNVQFLKTAAPDLQRMIDDARKALAEDQAKDDPDAKATTRVGLQSGYRSARSQLQSWQGTFHQHYKVQVEENGRNADSYASFLSGKAAAPGYSLHQLSRAIDVNTTFKSVGLGASSDQLTQWNASWFFKWLMKNASTYGFAQNPDIVEPWHWEHSGTPIEEPKGDATLKHERELTLVVGSEVFYNTYALKMMFFAPAVRDVLQAKAEDFDTFRIIYFTEGYVPAEIEAVKSALTNKPVEYVPVNNVTELLEAINDHDRPARIQRLNIYTHGFPKHIDFALRGTTWRAASFGMEHVPLVNPDVFLPDAQLWSYACQTGSGVFIKMLHEVPATSDFDYEYEVEVDGEFDNDAECRPGASLAQALANHLGREVHAWLVRTSYAGIWNDGGDTAYRAAFVDLPHPGLDGGLGRELESWLPGDDGDKDDVALWNPAGAKLGVDGADSPGGLARSPQTYKKP